MSDGTPRALIESMNAVLAGGVSIIPIDAATKRPIARLLPRDRDTGRATWKPYSINAVHPHNLREWQASGIQAFAVVGGEVSGGLLVLDFDVPEFYDRWAESVGGLADGLPVQVTGGGGFQVMLRCERPGGNIKLAWASDESHPTGRTVAIETRGEGGYAVMAPSLHPSGNHYEVIAGDVGQIPTVSMVVATALLTAARDLDERPLDRTTQAVADNAVREHTARQMKRASAGTASVIDAYNASHSVRDELIANGYRPSGRRMIRPDADKDSEPGVVFFDRGGNEISFHHSTNDPLNNGHAHDAFDVYAHFRHKGIVGDAVRAAAELLGMSAAKNTVLDIKAALAAPAGEPESDGVMEPQLSPSEELGKLMGGIIDGTIYAVPFHQPVITKLAVALLPGCTTCVSGDPGVGKTFFVLDQMQFWSGAGYNPAVLFLEKGRTFYMHRLLAMLEGNGQYIDYDWIKANPALVGDAMRRHKEEMDMLGACFHAPPNGRMTLADVTRWVVTKARAGHRVLVVDPITAAAAGQRRWEDDDEFVLGCENELADLGASLVVICHGKKANRPGAPTIHDVAMGAAFQRFSDTMLWIVKPKKPRNVSVLGTCGVVTAKFPLFLQIHKTRHGRGHGAEIAYTFTDRLRFKEVGIVQKDVIEDEEESEKLTA